MNLKIGNCLYTEENEDIYRYIKSLEAENKKYKEVIDKAINKLGIYADKMIDNGNAYVICVDLLHLLKEAKNE